MLNRINRKLDQKGFTLIELMIVVAIIGILAAIAIPNFRAYQLKAKRGEIPTNMKAIKTAEVAYQAEMDTFVALTASPDNAPVATKRNWADAGTGFTSIGWMASGTVYGSYSGVAGASGIATSVTATGICDVDADGNDATYTFIVDITTPSLDRDVTITPASAAFY